MVAQTAKNVHRRASMHILMKSSPAGGWRNRAERAMVDKVAALIAGRPVYAPSSVRDKDLKEVILATNTTVEGEATAHYISEMVKVRNLKVTRIAHGVPMGGELEFVNSMTIIHALDDRKVI